MSDPAASPSPSPAPAPSQPPTNNQTINPTTFLASPTSQPPAIAPTMNQPVNPLRESQIAAAVSFLSNPRVTSSSPHRRCAFLESKGLTSAEIAESLRRVAPSSAEYEAVKAGIERGVGASEATKHLDHVASQVTTPTAPVSTPISSVSYQHPQSYYPPINHSPPQQQGRDWFKWFLGLTAVGGLASSAYLASKSSLLPQIRFEYPSSTSPSIPSSTTDLMNQTSQSDQLNYNDLAPTVALSSPSQLDGSPSLARLSLSSLADDTASREAALLKVLGELRSEMNSMHSTIRESATDSKRLLSAMQQTIATTIANNSSINQQSMSSLNQQSFSSSSLQSSPIHASTSSLSSSPITPRPLSSSVTIETERPNGTRSDSDGDMSPVTSVEPATLESRLTTLQERVATLVSSNSNESLLNCLPPLNMYLSNLLSNIDATENRYAKVLTTNSAYKQRVAAINGAQDVLLAVGFKIDRSHLQWTPANPSDKSQDVQVLTQAKELIAKELIAAQAKKAAAAATATQPTNTEAPLSSA